MDKIQEFLSLIARYRELGIDQQIDYNKFCLYSIVTHSTAIEGSTITELENQLLLDKGITAKGKTIMEQMMNLDLMNAYQKSISLADRHAEITVKLLKELSALVMQHTGSTYKTALGEFSSAEGDLRLVNVTAGFGGQSYMSYNKVPAKLEEFCASLNSTRAMAHSLTLLELYNISFDAHYNLVTIHPWADGNGRMSRLLMNHLQFEFCLIPAKILKEDKDDYIKALVTTRECGDIGIFRNFMIDMMIKNLRSDIENYLKSTDLEAGENAIKGREKKVKSREKILKLLAENPKMTTSKLAEAIGITPKAVEKHLAKLKAEGLIQRIGPDKGGYWKCL